VTRLAVPVAAAAALTLALACSTAPTATVSGPACPGFTPPRLLVPGSVALPAVYTEARVGAEVTEEVVLDKTGAVKQTRLVASPLALLAPFAQYALEKGRFSGGTIEGNPVAVRGVITIPIGRPSALVRALILVEKPPRERPSALRSVPLFLRLRNDVRG